MLTIPAKVELAPGVEARGGACKRTEIAASGAAGESSATARLRASNNLVLIPTYQGAKTIGPLIDAILSLPASTEIILIDAGSTDGTRAEVENRSANDQRVGMIVRGRKLGIGSAHRLGWLHARRFGYKNIVTLDADLSHDPADIPRL